MLVPHFGNPIPIAFGYRCSSFLVNLAFGVYGQAVLIIGAKNGMIIYKKNVKREMRDIGSLKNPL